MHFDGEMDIVTLGVVFIESEGYSGDYSTVEVVIVEHVEIQHGRSTLIAHNGRVITCFGEVVVTHNCRNAIPGGTGNTGFLQGSVAIAGKVVGRNHNQTEVVVGVGFNLGCTHGRTGAARHPTTLGRVIP